MQTDITPIKNNCAQQGYNVYHKNCPARMVFDRLADKWALLIVHLLEERPIRFNQLRREIQGVSQKVLSQTLRKLERDGLIKREVITSMPIAVEYSLTTLGRTLADAINPLKAWSEANIETVLAAQKAYDNVEATA